MDVSQRFDVLVSDTTDGSAIVEANAESGSAVVGIPDLADGSGRLPPDDNACSHP